MKTKIIFPLSYADNSIEHDKERVYFLAGPIKDGGDWQKKAIELLSNADSGCVIACPAHYHKNPEFFDHAIQDSKPGFFQNQTAWERHYMNLASRTGCLIFWVPCENMENPRPKEKGPYARDTYGELGRWSTRSGYGIGLKEPNHTKPVINLSIGIEAEFSGLSVIQKNFNADHNGIDYPIYDSLQKTITEAVIKAKQL